MKEIIKKGLVPAMPEGIKIPFAAQGAMPDQEIGYISEKDIPDIVKKVQNGTYTSLLLTPNEEDMDEFLMMESSPELIFLQIWDGESETYWSCFNPDYLESNEEAPIECSDGQSVIEMRNTMANTPENRELAAKCAEWYIRTGEPYPGMDWLREVD